jgi:hypothetical protein
MRAEFLDEPELEFGAAARHVDIRFGLMDYGPLDQGQSRVHSPIRVGLVGTSETTELFRAWFERCRAGIPAKPSPHRNAFPRFPGASSDGVYRCEFVLDDRLTSVLSQKAIGKLLSAPPDDAASLAASQFGDAVRAITETANPDVVAVAPPRDLFDFLDDLRLSSGHDEATGNRRPELHDLVKARGLGLSSPIQFMRPETYDERQRRKQRGRSWLDSSTQDEATRAWNLHTALYYKAGGVPWRLVRDPRELTTCYVGISFFWSREGDRLLTSVAQVFNERGDGMILRGGTAELDKADRTPFLSSADASSLLTGALEAYRREHQTSPARVVIHKSARVVPDELAGFRAAADGERIDSLDVASIGDRVGIRLFRRATYPPLRGTRLSLDDETDLLYTRGSVDFYRMYPGMYVPSPILVRFHSREATAHRLTAEILALTKMNWNNTSFDGRLPITLRAARQVRDILRHVDSDGAVQTRYAYYM